MMYIELRHLRSIKAIHDTGGLARAADLLNITQSALSHQIKGIEEQVGVELFVRRSKPLKLSAAGLRLLATADIILPQISALEAEFEGLQDGRIGRLHIALECHACYEWLLPVLEQFRKAWPDVDVDIKSSHAFDAMDAMRREEVDLVLSSDPEEHEHADFTPLFDYNPVLVVSASHHLATKPEIEPQDFEGQTLLTYPVERARLDVFKMVLAPHKIEPAIIRQVELTAIILMLVASNRGISVLPDWVVRQLQYSDDIAVRQITHEGITRRMYAATRSEENTLPYLAHFIRLARQEAVKLQRE